MSKPEPSKANPFFWPSQWAVEYSFWREVATRTLAGILTLLLLSIPVTLYAWWSKTLTSEILLPIVIGTAIFLIVLVLYVSALGITRRIVFAKTRTEIGNDKSFEGPTPSVDDLTRASDKDSPLKGRLSEDILARIRDDESSYTTVGGIVTGLAVTIGVLATLLASFALTH